jgi:predicted peroxiredoxin
MGVMGVKEEDLIDGCEIAGAAAFLDFASEAEVQLFI